MFKPRYIYHTKYFIDTEFRERPYTIDLISIGIVCEDGREYYAIHKNFNLDDVWDDGWLRKNVLLPIYLDGIGEDIRDVLPFSKDSIDTILVSSGKSVEQIRKEIIYFICDDRPEFYGYYADYDWVVFCWIFGRMIDLPKGFPKYCMDLKQMMDDNGLDKEWKRLNCPDPEGEHNALVDARWNLKLFNELKLMIK